MTKRRSFLGNLISSVGILVALCGTKFSIIAKRDRPAPKEITVESLSYVEWYNYQPQAVEALRRLPVRKDDFHERLLRVKRGEPPTPFDPIAAYEAQADQQTDEGES